MQQLVLLVLLGFYFFVCKFSLHYNRCETRGTSLRSDMEERIGWYQRNVSVISIRMSGIVAASCTEHVMLATVASAEGTYNEQIVAVISGLNPSQNWISLSGIVIVGEPKPGWRKIIYSPTKTRILLCCKNKYKRDAGQGDIIVMPKCLLQS